MFEFDHRMMNTFSVRSMFEVLFDENLVNIKLLLDMFGNAKLSALISN